MNVRGRMAVGVAIVLSVGVSAARAAPRCNGVFGLENGALGSRFRCHYHHDVLRAVRATCHDGEAGCDADALCNGVCEFSLCADPACAGTFAVDVPLRRGGRAKRQIVLHSGSTRVVLRCLPPRRGCAPGVTTTTVATSTTTTTAPSPGCTVALSGAVDATVPCSTTFAPAGLGLPVFALLFVGPHGDGQLAALLVGGGTGSYRLGERMILVVARAGTPGGTYFQAVPSTSGASAELRLDSVAGTTVHGSLDAVVPDVGGGPALVVSAEF